MSENLKLLLSQEEEPQVEQRIYIQLLTESDHQDHVIKEVLHHLDVFTCFGQVKSLWVSPPPIPPHSMPKSLPLKSPKCIFLVVSGF